MRAAFEKAADGPEWKKQYPKGTKVKVFFRHSTTMVKQVYGWQGKRAGLIRVIRVIRVIRTTYPCNGRGCTMIHPQSLYV